MLWEKCGGESGITAQQDVCVHVCAFALVYVCVLVCVCVVKEEVLIYLFMTAVLSPRCLSKGLGLNWKIISLLRECDNKNIPDVKAVILILRHLQKVVFHAFNGPR